MPEPRSISRLVISALVAAAYAVMTIAAAAHSVLHVHDGSAAIDQHGSVAAHAPGSTAPQPDGSSDGAKSDGCFLCACNPLVFLFVVAVLMMAALLPTTIRYAERPREHALARCVDMPGLRAPPMFA